MILKCPSSKECCFTRLSYIILSHVITTQETTTRPFYLPIVYCMYFNCLKWCKILFCYSFTYIFHSSLHLYFLFISLPLMISSLASHLCLLVFLSLQPLTAPTASLCNAAARPPLLAFSSLSQSLLAAHSRRLIALFIDRGTGSQRRGCVWDLKRG